MRGHSGRRHEDSGEDLHLEWDTKVGLPVFRYDRNENNLRLFGSIKATR